VLDGYREGRESRRGVLRDLTRRGLKEAPKLAIADGGWGFWPALEEEFPQDQAPAVLGPHNIHYLGQNA